MHSQVAIFSIEIFFVGKMNDAFKFGQPSENKVIVTIGLSQIVIWLW